MTKKEFIELISNIQDNAIVSLAVFACGDVDLSNPNTAEIIQYYKYIFYQKMTQ